jgi:hypothetical protein
MLEKNILEPRDSNFAYKIMSFGKSNKPKVLGKATK